MSTHPKQPYTSPEFSGQSVTLDGSLCIDSKNPQGTNVVKDGNANVDVIRQKGWDDSTKGTFEVTGWDS